MYQTITNALTKKQPQPAILARPAALSRARDHPWPVLSGLRFILAMVVFIGHLGIVLPGWFVAAQFNGAAAVIGFFLISGYSIAASLDRDPAGYGDRRFWRIYPTYLAALVFACLPFALFGPLFSGFGGPVQAPATILPFLENALMLQGWITPPLGSDTPMWSLGVECTFYLLAPMLARLGDKPLVGIMAISVGCYIIAKHDSALVLPLATGGLPALILAWAWISGFFYHRHRHTAWASYLLWVPAILLLPLDNWTGGRFGSATIMLSALGLHYCRRIALTPKQIKAANYLGDLSYPIYLLHMPVAFIVYHIMERGQAADPAHWYYEFPVVVACVFCAAALIYHGIDLPCRKYAAFRNQIAKGWHTSQQHL